MTSKMQKDMAGEISLILRIRATLEIFMSS